LGEKWGVAFWNLTALSAIATSTYGAGGWWTTAAGNDGGTLMARDQVLAVPQYFLGKDRGLGESEPWAVFPDGTVKRTSMPLLARPLELGGPVWCNEFSSPDAELRALARRHVRVTTSLQLIEPLQHALGYVHDPEPRTAFHFDGQQGSLHRLHELLRKPEDRIGHLLHSLVNQYTTAGLSTVWGQTTSEWNGISAQTGTRDTILRAGAREMMADAEGYLAYALGKLGRTSTDRDARRLLRAAVREHARAKVHYDDWDYEAVLRSAQRVMSHTDRALTLLGEGDLIHDPLAALAAGEAGAPPVPSMARLVAPRLADLERSVARLRREGLAAVARRH
jgi:hypothetical protein